MQDALHLSNASDKVEITVTAAGGLAKENLVDQRLVRGFGFIEKLEASDDSDLRNAVVTEVFEPLEPGTDTTRGFYAQLGARASELYREYCKVS